MTHNRLFKFEVRKLAEQYGLSYTESKKRLQEILDASPDRRQVVPMPEPTIPMLLNDGKVHLGSGLEKIDPLDNFNTPKQSIVWDPSREAHIQVRGATGSGKTVLAGALVGALQDSWTIRPVDSSRVEWDNSAHTLDEALEVADFALDTIAARYSKRKDAEAHEATDETERPILLVLDGLLSFDTSDPKYDECIMKFEEILAKGRSAGVHVLELTQSQSAFSAGLDRNFAVTISMLNPRKAALHSLLWERGLALVSRYGNDTEAIRVASRRTLEFS